MRGACGTQSTGKRWSGIKSKNRKIRHPISVAAAVFCKIKLRCCLRTEQTFRTTDFSVRFTATLFCIHRVSTTHCFRRPARETRGHQTDLPVYDQHRARLFRDALPVPGDRVGDNILQNRLMDADHHDDHFQRLRFTRQGIDRNTIVRVSHPKTRREKEVGTPAYT